MHTSVRKTRPGSLNRPPRRHLVIAGFALIWLSLAAAPTELERVGTGDPREGYLSADYRTHSRSIGTLIGVPADLATLAAQPPLGLPALDNPPGRAAIDLGRRLFFDRRLSANQTLSCGMCHVPEQAFTQNELATPVGIEGRFVRRNAPSLYNVGYRRLLFHDGRETDLTAQIWAPLLADNEMGNTSRSAVLENLAAVPGYPQAFREVFDDGLTERNLGIVLSAYQQALLSADSPFDRWYFGGNMEAVSAAAKRGFEHFNSVGCARCHRFSNSHAHFTDDRLHRTGVEFASRQREAQPIENLQIAPGISIPISIAIERPPRNDEGRMEVSGRAEDRWRYRTPSLRNVAITGPYMHDGSLATLTAVIDFYALGAGDDPDRDPGLQPLDLTGEQKLELEAFLVSLTGANVDALAADARSTPIGDRVRPGEGDSSSTVAPAAGPETRLD
jgi:cytochrome c peroxidase